MVRRLLRSLNFRLSFQARITLLTMWAMLLVAVFSSFSLYTVAMQEATRQLGQRLLAVAVSGALAIDGEAHKTLNRPDQMDSPAYQKTQKLLRQLRDGNSEMRLRFLYTMAPTDKPGIWRYVVDAEAPTSKDFSFLGEAEDFTYDSRWIGAIEKPFSDDKLRPYHFWGRMLSASAPIRDKFGRAIGVLSVDAEPDEVIKALLHLKYWGIGLVMLGLVLSLVFSFFISRKVTRPISALILATRAIARGDFNHKVKISPREELTDLADAFNQMIEGLKERELYKLQFERYVSHQVARKILDNPETTFWVGERRKATILFCDIRGFTALSEKLPPEKVISLLNRFFSEMIDIIFYFEGTLDKFMGDALMAMFGAPLSSTDDEERAVRAAVAMQARLKQLNVEWQKEGFPGFQIGIGINTGDVVIGNIGSERRMDYSAIGDAVNTAARLEELTKKYQVSILISESTYKMTGRVVQTRPVGVETLKGRLESVMIYEVTGLKESSTVPSSNT